jgi:hypothetical protein
MFDRKKMEQLDAGIQDAPREQHSISSQEES